MTSTRKAPWWESGVIYQIYPRSFQDSNGDGIGDLRGIEQRLDYIAELGIDAIWLSPIFPSPMIDFGYDVVDYCGVDPMFGTREGFDRLLAAAHARGLRLLLDFVPSHSSDHGSAPSSAFRSAEWPMSISRSINRCRGKRRNRRPPAGHQPRRKARSSSLLAPAITPSGRPQASA
ncbi:MAG: hypothetical protein JF608_02365 [Sphingomonadales bacterium]|nr:hypothetical protein [Sphingomonadales bacterium]